MGRTKGGLVMGLEENMRRVEKWLSGTGRHPERGPLRFGVRAYKEK